MSHTTTRPAASNRPSWLIPAILCALTLLAYSNSFRVPFIFDDLESIPANTAIQNPSGIGDILFPKLKGGTTIAGRPVISLTLALNYAISGTNVWSYHVFNLAVHMATGLLLFGLARRTLPSRSRQITPAGQTTAYSPTLIAASIAALWLLHPIQTESVTYIIQRAETLVSFFYLLTLYCFARATTGERPQTRSAVWLAASFTACLLGMASKEVMVSAPLAVFLYDRTFVAGTFREAWRLRWRYYLSLLATWAVLALLIQHTGSRGGTVTFEGGVKGVWFYLLTQCKAIVLYLKLCLWPANQVFDYGVVIVRSLADVWIQTVLLLTLFGLSIYALVRKPAAGFLGFCFFAILAPSSSVVPIITQTIAEHRMYLALAIVITFFVLALAKFAKQYTPLVCGVLALAAGCATFARNHDYRSTLSIWLDSLENYPENARAQNNYGRTLMDENNDIDGAIAHYKQAIRIDPRYAQAYYNLGAAGSKKGLYTEAIICYREALAIEEDYPEAHNNLGNALCQLNQFDEAAKHLLRAIELKPDFAEPYNNYGNIVQQNARPEQAIEYFKKALLLNPKYAEAHSNWGNALAQLGRMEEAVTHYKECLRINPDYYPAQNNLGSAMLELGRMKEAEDAFSAALRIDPAMLEAKRNLAYVYVNTGRIPQALAIYRELLQSMPDEQGLRDEIAKLEALLK